MNRQQKQDLAFTVISHVANLFEDWELTCDNSDGLDHIDIGEAKEVIAGWMRKLPGSGWDARLGAAAL